MSDSIKKDAIKNGKIENDVNLGRESTSKVSNKIEHTNLEYVRAIDNRVASSNDHKNIKKYVVPVTSALLLAFLCMIFIANFFYESRASDVSFIVNDLNTLVKVFESIDKTCGIIGFDYEKNSINFLNVISFAGSEIGPMNLRHPEKWQGPYVKDNPSFQYKEYQVLKTSAGYFITPGDGVKLPNGKVVGTDIKTDKSADISALMYQKDAFLVDNQPLAIALPVTTFFGPKKMPTFEESVLPEAPTW